MNPYVNIVFAMLGLFFLVLVLVYVVFWLWMLSDLVHKKFKTRTMMLEWFLLVIFVPLFGPLLYYYVIKKKEIKIKKGVKK